jgi:hypothetical protein
MEGLILIGLAGAGYLINANDKDKKTKIDNVIHPTFHQGSNTSIYNMNNLKDAQNYEKQLVDQKFKQSMDPQSNIVNDFAIKNKELNLRNAERVQTLSGTELSKKDFLTNDQGVTMAPFFKGEGFANINFEENRKLSMHQGGFKNEFYKPKKEVNINLPPQKNVGNVFGMKDSGKAMDQDRYIPGKYKTDERPFEQERVPHIDRNSSVNRDIGEMYALRNNIDNTRTLSNQKVSFGSRINAGKGMSERGKEGQVFKHLPDRDYEQRAEQWLITTGAVSTNTVRPAEIIPETNRQHLNRQELGPAGSTISLGEGKRPMVKKSTNQQLIIDTNRNVGGDTFFIDGDHNQSSYKVYPNEREVTESRTYEGNMKSVYTSETTRLQDNVKPTIKETTLSPKNINGFTTTVTQFPEERLQDNIRTTKKDTVLFEHQGNPTGSTKQEMAQDQYFRSDTNPNREIIAQGRSPTTESVKLPNGMDTLNVDIQKIESDYFNQHISGMDKVYQTIPTEETCKFTRDKDTLDNRKISYRIEGDLLDPFKKNPYTQSLQSYAYS